ncbi:hypothetical protein RM545_03715 [Zunongwangia sp. F260]|uniref:Uncharacterized protein n=1 Tax=Autumnicola lenta TaxID=3075593 RepID=A0ABU3CHF5_9FLAO|nr:hypothetical protein [Zunongwangia sp. F260]MDT0645784.1 hypothetical protein [Zunongwangia sp. F260]
MEKFLVFGKRATNALWEDESDLDAVVEAIDDLEAELCKFDPQTTPVHEILNMYSQWTDYSYLTPEQYTSINERL